MNGDSDVELSSTSSDRIFGSKDITIDELLEHIPIGKFHYWLLFVCGLAFAADAMEISLLSYIGQCAGDEWGLSSSQQASISSFVFVGELLGSLIWGRLADQYGRKTIFTAGCIIITVAGLLSAISTSYLWLVFFRLLVGFGVGCVTVPFDILAEFLPVSKRGQYLIYIEYYWSMGTVAVNGIAWLTLSRQGWRFLTYLTAAPVIVTMIASIMLLPESPRWLMIQGRKKEAEDIFHRHLPIQHQDAVNMQQLSLRHDNSKPIISSDVWDLFRGRSTRRITCALLLLWFCFGFSYFAMLLQLSKLYTTSSTLSSSSSSSSTSDHNSCSFDYQSLFISSAAELVGITFAVVIIDRIGRVRSQVIFYLIAACTLLMMGGDVSSTMLLMSSFVGRAALLGAASVTWVATPELFPTELRGTGHGICNAFARIGGFFAPYFILSSLSAWSISIIVCTMCLLAATAATMLPETTGCLLDNDVMLKDVDHAYVDQSHSSRKIGDGYIPVTTATPTSSTHG